MKADIFRLIIEVGRRRALWDSRLALGTRKSVGPAQWMEVAEIMQMDLTSCKKRFKGLRDSYRSEVRKIQTHRIQTSSWPYFRAMEYLRDIFDPDKLLTFAPMPFDIELDRSNNEQNLDDFIVDVDNDDSFDFEIMGDIFKRDSVEPQHQDSGSNLSDIKKSDNEISSSSLTTSLYKSNRDASPRLLSPILPKVPQAKRGRRRRHSSSSTDGPYSKSYAPRMSSPRPVIDQGTREDPNYNFLVSLLPHVNSLSSMSNMKFRADVSRMLMDLNQEDMQRAQQGSENASAPFHNEPDHRRTITSNALNGIGYNSRSSIIECDVKIENEPFFRD